MIQGSTPGRRPVNVETREIMPYGTVFRPDLFAGETIIVTGGGSGMGRCTAHELAHLGAKVVLVGRRWENLDSAAHNLEMASGLPMEHLRENVCA